LPEGFVALCTVSPEMIAALAALAVVLCIAEAARPNILFVLVDDLGWNDLSFHGSPQIPTPHIDSIAQSGQALDRFYVGQYAAWIYICDAVRDLFAAAL
jgi:hypothetical protein